MKTILYPTRGGDSTHDNQDWVFSLAKETDARLILLYVSDVRFLDNLPTTIAIDRVYEELDQMGDFLLTMAQVRAEKLGLNAEKIVKHGRFREALKETIEEEKVTTVILGRPTKGTGLTTPEYIQEIASFLTAETNVEVYLIHEGEMVEHILPDASQ